MRIYAKSEFNARRMTGRMPLLELPGGVADKRGFAIEVTEEQTADEIVAHRQLSEASSRLDELDRRGGRACSAIIFEDTGEAS